MAEWGSAHCGCGCRPAEATGAGCPCAECQPGPGLEYGRRHQRNRRLMQARMGALLRKESLNDAEQVELDGLLHDFIHS